MDHATIRTRRCLALIRAHRSGQRRLDSMQLARWTRAGMRASASSLARALRVIAESQVRARAASAELERAALTVGMLTGAREGGVTR
tara:strand:- start:1712 stop:1972 length:261 start_codon:yes stop_codon:yes gene_type:complete